MLCSVILILDSSRPNRICLNPLFPFFTSRGIGSEIFLCFLLFLLANEEGIDFHLFFTWFAEHIGRSVLGLGDWLLILVPPLLLVDEFVDTVEKQKCLCSSFPHVEGVTRTATAGKNIGKMPSSTQHNDVNEEDVMHLRRWSTRSSSAAPLSMCELSKSTRGCRRSERYCGDDEALPWLMMHAVIMPSSCCRGCVAGRRGSDNVDEMTSCDGKG
jgi:hypothetical protein